MSICEHSHCGDTSRPPPPPPLFAYIPIFMDLLPLKCKRFLNDWVPPRGTFDQIHHVAWSAHQKVKSAKQVKLFREHQQKYNQWTNTNEVIHWFSNISDKQNCKFIQFNIKEFYHSISEETLKGLILQRIILRTLKRTLEL